MNKKYVWYLFKQWIPVFAVTFAILASIFWMTVTTMSIEITVYEGEEGLLYYNTVESGLLGISIPALLVASFYPVFVYSYRYSKTQADIYSQAPFKERELKAIRLTLGIILLLVAFTVVYWLGIMIVAIRQATEVPWGNNIIADYNYLGYFMAYWILLVFIILQYFICSFLAQLGNRPLDSIIYIILGQLILAFAVLGIYLYLETMVSYRDIKYYAFSWANYSIYTPIYAHYELCNSIIVGIGTVSMNVSDWLSMSGFIVLGLGAGFLSYFLKDPSGEHYGKPGARNIYISILPHIAMFIVALAITQSVVYHIVYMLLFFVLWSVGYMMILVYLNRGFRLKKRDWIIFGSVCAGVFTLYLVAIAVYSSY